MNNVAPVIKEIADSCGIDQKNVIVNDLYLQWVLQPSYEMIVVCGTPDPRNRAVFRCGHL